MPPALFPYARARLLIAAVAHRHGLQPRDLVERSRWKHIDVARKEAIREVASAFPKFTTRQIGRLFDGRHHTTILQAIGKPRPNPASRGRAAARRARAEADGWRMARVDGVTFWRLTPHVDRRNACV